MIDAHQHFWTTARDDYAWLSPDDPILYRDFGPGDLAPLLAAAGIERTVLVQAAPTVAETDYLLDLARRTDFVAGVVGWLPLDEPSAGDDLARLSSDPHLVGVRPMIQDLPNDEWMLGSTVGRSLEALSARGLAFDALVRPRHLCALRTLCGRYPELRIVVDHAAKPDIAGGDFDDWARGLGAIADETTACCKLSGLVTEASLDWRPDTLRRYVDWLLERFGPHRLLWGSDWPVVELAGGFERWYETAQLLLAELNGDERESVFGGTAARVYGLNEGSLASGGTE